MAESTPLLRHLESPRRCYCHLRGTEAAGVGSVAAAVAADAAAVAAAAAAAVAAVAATVAAMVAGGYMDLPRPVVWRGTMIDTCVPTLS